MKKYSFLILGLFFTLSSLAQKNGIYGICALKDTKKELAGVEIVLLDSSRQVIATTVTDANGNWGFVIESEGIYFIQYNDGRSEKTLDAIQYNPKSSIKIHLLVSNQSVNTSPNSDRKVITAKEMDQLPPTQQNNALINRARYYSEKGVIKSASNGAAPVYFIDGQRVTSPNLVPGSIDQMQILNH